MFDSVNKYFQIFNLTVMYNFSKQYEILFGYVTFSVKVIYR